MKKIALFFLIFMVLGFIGFSQTPKTFYIGHSLSDQIPDMVQSLSNDHPDVDFQWVYQSIPGAPLHWQWDRKELMDYEPIDPNYYGFYDATNGLPSGDFDVMVLTEAVPRYPAIIGETYAYADSFYTYAVSHNPNIRVYLYEDWHCINSGTPTQCAYDIDSNPWRQRLSDDLPMWESVVDTLNARFNPEPPVCLIPAGQGLAALYDSIAIGAIPGLNDITDIFSDDHHLTDVGKYFVACIHFAMIHEMSPVGLTNQLQVWWGGDFEAPSTALALKFQAMAWETVNNYPKSCLNISTAVTREHFLSDIQLDVSPNPFTNQLTIKCTWDNFSVQVLDAAGKCWATFESNTDQLKVNLSHLPDGVYVIKATHTNDGLSKMTKLVKHSGR